MPTVYSRYAKSSVKRALAAAILIILGVLCVRTFFSKVVILQLPNVVQDLFTLASSVVIESFPFVMLGIVLSIIVQVWLPDGFIINHLPKWAPLRRLSISCMGVLLPVCECGNIPLARGLIVKGFTVPESLVFLLAAPLLNPITILTTQQAFSSDPTIVIARIAGGFLIANFIGWLYSLHKNPQSLLTTDFAASCDAVKSHSHATKKIDQSFDIFMREATNIMPILFLGAFLAAAIQTVVPREVLVELGANPALSILSMMILAFVISICSNVDAFFALAFKGTFSAGSLVSFLVFGPMIDIKMLALMRTTYRTGVLLQITLLVALFSAAIGLVVNYAF